LVKSRALLLVVNQQRQRIAVGYRHRPVGDGRGSQHRKSCLLKMDTVTQAWLDALSSFRDILDATANGTPGSPASGHRELSPSCWRKLGRREPTRGIHALPGTMRP
jgi:hypothetical protein